jgi:hypothetical protein
MARDHAAYMAEWKARNPEAHFAIVGRYESTEKGRDTRRRARQAWKARNPELVRERARIRMRVVRAERLGILVRQSCEMCGDLPVHGHHANGYGPGHELDLVWLCVRHHRIAHGMPVRDR